MNLKMTPMLKQYMEIKEQQKDAILFFRMGDFYEMFLDDAYTASKILDIALTSRQNDVPMCGVPYHSADNYIARLIKAGKRVAICEQIETAPESSLMRREVVRVITSGTLIESNLLESDDNNFLAAAVLDKESMGIAFVDISTGDFYISSMKKSASLFRCEMTRFNPTEIVINDTKDDADSDFLDYINKRGIPMYRINKWLYDTDYMRKSICDVFQTAGTKGLGIVEDIDIVTAGSIIQYLKETQRKTFEHLKPPKRLLPSDRMLLDEATIGSLELVRNQQDGSRERTLFSLLNRTQTPMGRRLLERNILQPLLSKTEIERRLSIVRRVNENQALSAALSVPLKGIYDIERIISRFTLGKIITKNFISAAESISHSMDIKKIMRDDESLSELAERIPDCGDLAETIQRTIAGDPALNPEQGRVVKEGYDEELDRLYSLRSNSKEWVVQYQEEEKLKVGASTLKVRYNKIIGYYIEISKAQAGNLPKEYYRKQTLIGYERFTTDKLQEFEQDILSASDKIIEKEKAIIDNLCAEIRNRRADIQAMAETVAEIDFYVSLAAAASENRFVMPSINENGVTFVREARHPVVEKYYTEEVFIPNDIIFDGSENIIQIITGPNMSGKSTYIRMSGIIQLMAQIGSFVPAKEADFPIVDRIFTRIGASDNISRGESTFLVEMNETANIVNNATENSLIIMDEVGRGTSTYDGLSIAWAVVEYILRYIKAKTMFATHYHELTQLGKKQGIVNYNIMVSETVKGVDFLHKVAPGASGKSYGIHVAKLAGLPAGIISRASGILDKLEKNSSPKSRIDSDSSDSSEQLEIFNSSNHIVIQAIEKIDCESITPIEALNELNRLKRLIK
ncbi:MAG: DNA mismatch repair protein MutS [Spirochaetia bacterium]|jgi:DNA mismatch repair protein MutS|nr:DNA mismatch repair protein MutS [Spirochaetia bacterium]